VIASGLDALLSRLHGKELKKMKSIKSGIGLLARLMLIFTLAVTLSSCSLLGPLGLGGGGNALSNDSIVTRAGDSWVIYWYMCGSDLETRWGCATKDLEEMLAVTLPDNVEIIIQTGGALDWQNNIDPNSRQILRYSSAGAELLENWSVANMGNPETLIEFLNYCNSNYPADRRMLLFWDHGGGSLGGVCNDEQFDMESLSLYDLEYALKSTSQTNDGSPLYELVGFDACLMASIDVAAVFTDYARYMVASQEIEPGDGWEYTGLLSALSADTSMDGAEFGREICDSYLASMDRNSINIATLSVVDLHECKRLLDAYDRLGDEVLVYASMNHNYLGAYSRLAMETDNFYNSPSTGYTNMMDLGDLVLRGQEQGLFPLYGNKVLDALRGCVVYQVTGPGHSRAWGLSCFYNYAGSPISTQKFLNLSKNTGYNYFNEYMYEGELSNEGVEYVKVASANLTGQSVTPTRIDTSGLKQLEGHPLVLGASGQWQLNVGSELAGQIAAVYTTQAWVSPDSDVPGFLGLYGMSGWFPKDYENGLFTANFQNDWGALGNLPLYMEPMSSDVAGDLYTAPVLINEERYSLIIMQNRETGGFELLGAALPVDTQTGMAGKELYQLQDGDRVQAIMYCLLAEGVIDQITGSRLFDMPLGETTYRSDMIVHLRPVSGLSVYEAGVTSHFIIKFVIVDYAGNTYYSAGGYYAVTDGVVQPYEGTLGNW